MVRLNIDILDKRNNKCIGQTSVNILLFLKKNISDKDTSPFEEIGGIFPITRPQ